MKNRAHLFAFALFWGLASASVRADAINSLIMADMTSTQFKDLFTPLTGTNSAALSSSFQYAGAPISGVVQSQVFQGTGSNAGLYAYAYQFDMKNVADSDGNKIDLRGASWKFDSVPVASDLIGLGHDVGAYVIKDAKIGDMNAPTAVNGQAILAPSQLNFEQNTKTGSLLAGYFDPSANTPALAAGANSATFLVLSHQPPTQRMIGLLSALPTDPAATGLPVVYSPTNIVPSPVPEPAAVLAWAGVLGAASLARRFRKGRAA